MTDIKELPKRNVDIRQVKAKDLPYADVTVGPIEASRIHKFPITGTDSLLKVSQETYSAYEIALGLDQEKRSLWTRFKSFLRAENQAGRIAKVVKDTALFFAPRWLNYGVDTVDDFILNQIGNDMTTTEESKSTVKSKTVMAFGALFIVGTLQLLGVDLGLEVSPDAAWVSVGAGVLGIIFRLLTGKPVKLGQALGISDS